MIGGITPTSYVNSCQAINSDRMSLQAGSFLKYNGSVSQIQAAARLENDTIQLSQTDKTKKTECQTCKERKYVDGSNEGNVSFKVPGHISPETSGSVVAAHEQEHVANARAEGTKEGVRLVSASVKLSTAVCPECGRTYTAGGTTTTQMKYNENNPYEQARKTIEGSLIKGQNIDIAA